MNWVAAMWLTDWKFVMTSSRTGLPNKVAGECSFPLKSPIFTCKVSTSDSPLDSEWEWDVVKLDIFIGLFCFHTGRTKLLENIMQLLQLLVELWTEEKKTCRGNLSFSDCQILMSTITSLACHVHRGDICQHFCDLCFFCVAQWIALFLFFTERCFVWIYRTTKLFCIKANPSSAL